MRVVGAMSLSYYVVQAFATNVVPPTSETGVVHEWLLAGIVYGLFLAAATLVAAILATI